MKIQMRIVNRAITISDDDGDNQCIRVKVLQVRISEQQGIWSPWENVPEYDAEDVEEEQEEVAASNVAKSLEEMGL